MDSPTNTPLTERVANSIKELSSAAQDLNTVSGELGKAISAIDAVLQTLNIGVPTWTTIAEGYEGEQHYWSRDIGYDKVGNKWGIALREAEGDPNWPPDESCDTWLFNDAPRRLRIEGIEKIPDLIDALIKKAQDTTEKIKAKTAKANQLATAIAQAAGQEKPKGGK